MVFPQIPTQFPLPSDGGKPLTYPELLKQLSCICTAGTQIKPSTLPSATVNLSDIIADQTQLLTALTSAYAMIAVVMKLIVCIIDVLCAIPNPFALISAMSRLFGTCLPEFILILPQIAIPAHILCVIKIVIAIVRFILETIIPVIEDIIQNVQDLIDAIDDGNKDSIDATAFKITQLLKEIINIVGVIATLDALVIMIKALITAGIRPPCGGSGGSCVGCGDNQCPSVIQQFSIDGTDGNLLVLFRSNFDFDILFTSQSKKSDFLQIRNFFPDIDYSRFDDPEKAAYRIEVGGNTYVVTSVDASGNLNLIRVSNPIYDDGYLSSVYDASSVITPVPDASNQIRFGTKTKFFSSESINNFINIRDTNLSGSGLNSGTYEISYVYDNYNVILTKAGTVDAGDGWNADAVLDPSYGSGPGDKLVWKYVEKYPSSLTNQNFSLKINHDELIRHDMISIGCHPDVSAQAEGLSNRFPFATNLTLPDFPLSINSTTGRIQSLDDALACFSGMIPSNISDLDTNFVLDNYQSIANSAASAELCLNNSLGNLENNLKNYAKNIYPRLISVELSDLSVDKTVQFVNGDIEITLTAIDIYGNSLSDDVPAGTIDAKIFSSFGVVGNVKEILDEDGIPTGEYKAILTSSIVGAGEITASIADNFISHFVDNYETTQQAPDLINKSVLFEFVEEPKKQKRPEYTGAGSVEPIGIATPSRG